MKKDKPEIRVSYEYKPNKERLGLVCEFLVKNLRKNLKEKQKVGVKTKVIKVRS